MSGRDPATVIVTDHALTRYRERIDAEATYDAVCAHVANASPCDRRHLAEFGQHAKVARATYRMDSETIFVCEKVGGRLRLVTCWNRGRRRNKRPRRF